MELKLCFNCMKEKPAPGPCPHCGFDENAYEPAPHHLPLGTILAGKYLIGRVLGEGGFGITYVGWDLNLELKVAVKEYYPNGMVTRNCGVDRTLTVLTGQRAEFFQKGLTKFVDEAKRLGKFWRLPGIVAVKDYFQENRTGYIVMEFVEGHTLKEILKKSQDGRLPADQVFSMLRPVMKSLEEVHREGLIHRDISPDNLMVSRDGRVKLIDFGAARDFLAEGEKSLSVMLKPGYAPEEQYRSRGNQGPWTDVYGLCATMYRAITGQVPEESLDRMAEDTLLAPSQMGVLVAHWQEAALMKGLAVFQKDRFQSMEELETALYPAAGGYAADAGDGPGEGYGPAAQAGGSYGADPRAAGDYGTVSQAAGNYGMDSRTTGSPGNGLPLQQPPEDSPNTEKASAGLDTRRKLIAFLGGAAGALALIAVGIFLFSGRAVTWTDPNLERLVRAGLDKPEGDITKKELARIQVMRISGDEIALYEDAGEDTGEPLPNEYPLGHSLKLTSLEDLKYFKGIKTLQLTNIYAGEGTVFGAETAAGEGLEALESLENLKSLDLSDNDLEDISGLYGLENLETLNLSSNRIADTSGIAALDSLETLNLSSNEVTDVSGIAAMDGLVSLDVSGNPVSDISSLTELGSLKELDISQTSVQNFWALEQMTGLTSLGLRDTYVAGIGSFSEEWQANLERLDLSSNKLTEVEGLAALTNLKELDLSGNDLTDISPLANLSRLEVLDVGFNELTSVEVLENLGNLRELSIEYNDVTDISFLAKLGHLKALNISSIECEDFQAVQGLTGLTRLEVNGNGLTNVGFLSGLTNLIYLDVSSNDLAGAEALEGLAGLKELDLSFNELTDLSGIGRLTGVEKLDLGYNDQLTDIGPVSELRQLKQLDIAGTLVASLEGLGNLEGLKKLAAYDTNITSKGCEALEGMTSLAYLDLEGTKVEDSVYKTLASLPHLTGLDLSNTGLSGDGSFLAELSADMEDLDIGGTALTGISGIPELKYLRELTCNNTQISEIYNLADLKYLEYLYMTNAAVKDISALAGLSRLETLYLDENSLSGTSIDVLAGMTGLEKLSLDGVGLVKLDALSGLTGLKELSFTDNSVESLEPLAGLTGLETLDFGGNQVESLEPLAGLTSLESLDFSDNQVAGLEPLAGMTLLYSLWANNNQISDITPLSQLIALEYLHLDENKISDVSPVMGLPFLETLSVEENPVGDLSGLEELLPGVDIDY